MKGVLSSSPGFSSVLMLRWCLVRSYTCGRVGSGICVCGSRFYQVCWDLYLVCVLDVVLRNRQVVIEIFRKLTATLFQCVFCNTRVSTRGGTRVSKCCPDIQVGDSRVACGYRRARLCSLVERGYLLSREASRQRTFGVGVVSFRVS